MPGRHEEPLEVVRREVLGLVRDARARADERHVAASTLSSCGSSSRLVFRSHRPNGVIGVLLVELVEAVRRRRPPRRSSSARCTARCAASSVSDAHRAELEHGERSHPLAEPRLPEEHRARASRAGSATRRTANERRGRRAAASDATTMSSAALERAARTGRASARGRPISGSALDRVDAGRAGRAPRTAGHDVDLDVELRLSARSRAMQLVAVGSCENATMTRSTSLLARRAREALGRAEHRHVRRGRRAARAASSSTKPTSVMPYSGCCIELARDRAGRRRRRRRSRCSACTRRWRRHSRARDRAAAGDEHDRQRPERDQLRRAPGRRAPVSRARRRRAATTPTVTR